jgi:hypothetical protein
MNAMTASRHETLEERPVSFDENTNRLEQFVELRSDVRHIQSDLTEAKAEVRAVTQRLDMLRDDLTGKIEKVGAKVDLLRDSLASAKVWALLLYIALAGSVLLVLARGFKWIGARFRARAPARSSRFAIRPTTIGDRLRSAANQYVAPVAQLDRVLPSEGRGRGFESRRARHFAKVRTEGPYRAHR